MQRDDHMGTQGRVTICKPRREAEGNHPLTSGSCTFGLQSQEMVSLCVWHANASGGPAGRALMGRGARATVAQVPKWDLPGQQELKAP